MQVLLCQSNVAPQYRIRSEGMQHLSQLSQLADKPCRARAAESGLRLLYRLPDQLFAVSTDIFFMQQKKSLKKTSRCAYIMSCYLADELKCFGYKIDCALYQESNGEYYSQGRFDQAMDDLINKTRKRHDKAKS